MPRVEDEFLDVLQNIELAIFTAFQDRPEMLDFEVEQAVNNLIRLYQAEQKKRSLATPAQKPNVQIVYEQIKAMCDFRLGRGGLIHQETKDEFIIPDSVTLDDMVACLKRIRKSIKFWSKEEGRRGYLNYISEFF